MVPIILVLIIILRIYFWIVIARVIFSWLYAFNVVNTSNQFVSMVGKFLYDITEPVLKPIYNFLYKRLKIPSGGIDLSPVALALLLFLIEAYLKELANYLR